MLIYFLHLVHKLKWSGMLGLLHLASRIYFPDMCLRQQVSWYRLLMLPEARARKEKKIFARRAKLQKIFFIFIITTHRVLSLIGAAMSRVRPAMSSQIQELDSQHYVRFDHHAIAVAAIGDDCNKSFYLPRKHHSI